MKFYILLSSIFLSWVILIPIAMKCEIRLKISLLGSTVIGIAVGAIIIPISPTNITSLIAMEIGFIIIISGLIMLSLFFRDPKRLPPDIDNAIIAPADGYIRYIKHIDKGKIPVTIKGRTHIAIEEFTDSALLNNGCWLIGIVMTYIDVHINRAPVDGEILFLKHIKGNFLSLKYDQAIVTNDRVSMIIRNDKFKIGIVLITSRLVRKILVWVKKGDVVNFGQKIGKIVFGSQTDIIIPALPGLKFEVKEKQQVYAGKSVIATFK